MRVGKPLGAALTAVIVTATLASALAGAATALAAEPLVMLA